MNPSAARLQEIGQRIDRLRQAQRLTYEQLARKAGFDERTVRNIVHGQPSRPWTLRAVCEAVGLTDIDTNLEVIELSDESHGAYSRKQMEKYCGSYTFYRRSYGKSNTIVRSQIYIFWSAERKCLAFTEIQRSHDKAGRETAYSLPGEIYMNDVSGLLHFLTISGGMVKLLTLTQLQIPEMAMKGGVFTQARMAFYRRPAIAPVLLKKVPDPTQDESAVWDDITPADPEYNEIADELQAVEQEVLLTAFGEDGLKDEARGTSLDDTMTKLTLR